LVSAISGKSEEWFRLVFEGTASEGLPRVVQSPVKNSEAIEPRKIGDG